MHVLLAFHVELFGGPVLVQQGLSPLQSKVLEASVVLEPLKRLRARPPRVVACRVKVRDGNLDSLALVVGLGSLCIATGKIHRQA